MSNLENFKSFVKENPSFASYIKDGSMTWQKFYELYDMYGTDSDIWKEYREKKKSATLNDIVTLAKNVDLDKLQEGIGSISKAVGLLSELVSGTSSKTTTDSYRPRAVYQRFDD